MRSAAKTGTLLNASVSALTFSSTATFAIGDKDNQSPPPSGRPSGDVADNILNATATATSIKVTQVNGGASGNPPKALAPVAPNWEPPAYWYEPVATPQQLNPAWTDSRKAETWCASPHRSAEART